MQISEKDVERVEAENDFNAADRAHQNIETSLNTARSAISRKKEDLKGVFLLPCLRTLANYFVR